MLSLLALFTALLALVTTSVSAHLLSLNTFIPQIPLVACAYASLRRPFTEAITLCIALSFCADLLSSGPPGMHQLALSIAFLLTDLASRRLNGHLLILGPLIALCASLLHDALLGGMLAVRYPQLSPLPLMARSMLFNGAATAAAFLPFGLWMAWVERLWAQRSDRRFTWR